MRRHELGDAQWELTTDVPLRSAGQRALARPPVGGGWADYERRALSRRNKAIRAFDESCAAIGCGSPDLASISQNEPVEESTARQGQPTPP